MISKEEVLKIAKLSRLELNEKEVEKMQKDLSGILDYFNILKKAPKKSASTKSKKVEMENNTLRKDVVISGSANVANDLLRLAPETKDRYYKVKQIL